MAEKLFLEGVDEESSNSALCCTEVLEVHKELGEAGKQMTGLCCAILVESNSKA